MSKTLSAIETLKQELEQELFNIIDSFPNKKYDDDDDEDFTFCFRLYSLEEQIAGLRIVDNKLRFKYIDEFGNYQECYFVDKVESDETDYNVYIEELSVEDIQEIIDWFKDNNLVK